MKRITRIFAALLLAIHLPAQTMLVIVSGTGSGGGGGGGTIALIAHGAAANSSSTTTVTVSGLNMTGANFIALHCATFGGGSLSGVSDSSSNTYTALTSRTPSSLFYVVSPTVTSSMSFTCTGTGINPSIQVAGFSGVALSSTLESQSGVGSSFPSSVTTVQPGSLTPAANNELIITGFAFDPGSLPINVVSISSPFAITNSISSATGVEGGSLAYEIQTTATAQNPTWTADTATYVATTMAVFK